MSKSEKWQKRRHSLKCYNGSVTNHKTREGMGRKCALRVFLCSDSTLSDETILEYYSHRWTIEVLFRAHKRYMGLKSFMVRAAKALDRLLLVLEPV